MSRVIAYRESNWMDAVCDRGYWHLACKAYGVGLTMFDPDTETAPEIGSDETVVIMDEQGKIRLEDFKHPENCVYIFGRTHSNELVNTIRHDHSVVIEYSGDNCVFGITAVGIVLEDRKRQLRWQ
jgi:hypothetical protein